MSSIRRLVTHATVARHKLEANAARLSMKSLATAGLLAALGLASCAGYGGEAMLKLPMEVVPTRIALVQTPDAIQTATGARFHGRVCRRTPHMAPTRIRVERIGADGAVVGAASRILSGLGGRGHRCAFYDVTTDWTLGPSEKVRVCAARSDKPCLSADPASQ